MNEYFVYFVLGVLWLNMSAYAIFELNDSNLDLWNKQPFWIRIPFIVFAPILYIVYMRHVFIKYKK